MVILKQKAKRWIIAAAAAAAVVVCLALVWGPAGLFAPALAIETTQAESEAEVTLDVTLSALPEELYPAASVSIRFDKDKLEFKGVQPGTMLVYDNDVPGGKEAAVKTAEWLCDPQACNAAGMINAMYLDMTGGKNAYGKDGFGRDTKDVLLRLRFQVKDGAGVGEKLLLEFVDAVLAAENGDQDGTSLTGGTTLKLVDGSIEII